MMFFEILIDYYYEIVEHTQLLNNLKYNIIILLTYKHRDSSKVY